MIRKEVSEEIKRQCDSIRVLNNGWYCFVYRRVHFISIPDEEMIRMSIPHVDDSNKYKREVLDKAINETNREVKFIKALILNNGSISLNYDHRIGNDEKVGEIVAHMILTLFAASGYLKNKLQENI